MMIVEQLAASENAFATIDAARLDAADSTFLDTLPFGVIGLSSDNIATAYNATLIGFGGMKRENVLGQSFFLVVGVCMNNFMVAQRFEDEDTIDTIIDYVLTFRMRPTPVKLRLLKRPNLRSHFLLIRQ